MNDPYYPILKSQEEKQLEEWKSCKDDEELARKLQQLEINDNSNSNHLSKYNPKNDELYALKLLKDEKFNGERKKTDLQRMKEEDEMLARRLQEEEKRQIQLEEDELVAKKLMEEEKRLEEKRKNSYFSSPYIPPPPINYPSYNYPNYSYSNPYSQNIPYDKRNHSLTTHNRYCTCGKTSTWNNNHIFEIHTRNCGCDLNTYRPYNYNQGKKHDHDYRCCTLNHLHAKTCKCVYRDHLHDENCCNIYHKHNEFCNCSSK